MDELLLINVPWSQEFSSSFLSFGSKGGSWPVCMTSIIFSNLFLLGTHMPGWSVKCGLPGQHEKDGTITDEDSQKHGEERKR